MVNDIAAREFHVSRKSRDRYQFDQALFSITGNVIFADFHAVRVFAQKMNRARDLVRFPEQTVRAGDVNAMGLIDEILHYIVHLYRQQKNPQAMIQALDWLCARMGRDVVDRTLALFVSEFPPLAVYRGQVSLDDYMAGETAGVANRVIALEELLMLWVANMNPALAPFLELFDDANLETHTAYSQLIPQLRAFFETQPRFGPDHQNLVDMLRAPALASPGSLEGQLDFIRTRWGMLVASYLSRLLSSLDLIHEDQAFRFLGGGPATVPVYDFHGYEYEFEPERYSRDLEWMPRLVLLAKNIYVWLHQLSVRYQMPLTRLDQVPDEELDLLAQWGFTGLWLIGLWERSPASRRIKQMMGNPEAVASAYSVFDYEIAGDLGGEAAMQNLRERAWRRGIRLASDMVPNHMAIDSRWLLEHPEWFVELDYSPFPSYSFSGPDLSWDARVGVYLEDHYYNRSDAAVVFKRLDKWTGSVKYVYHGNDGTSMPWNDTAQLNYMRADVREAVIQTILSVAKRFPVIRFDAAMTLAKKHYQRLWFPEPGSGGAIPSRAEHGMTKAEFDAAMPVEFWREVVDRIAVEAPETLLLAEAFWLMEGYFVRTLGMHRVYNSAFMNMLRDEDNGKYRLVMKNTLEFDPEILKRYVNFMNNPDERTAIDQFGKDDKYFGVCTMMATLPGLPMFGHGQIEGYAEKYGMEYQRAYWDEQPNSGLIERHAREIFPLLRKRYLFAGVDNFLLYDFYTPEGFVNEDVFAYSNCSGNPSTGPVERALVVYQNKFGTANGWIRNSSAYAVKSGKDDERQLVQRSLGEGWGLGDDANTFVIFRDSITGLEYIRNSKEMCEKGLHVELHAYQYQVFMDVREVQDNEQHHYAVLAARLNGAGVPSVNTAVRELVLEPVLGPFRELANPGMLRWLLDNRVVDPDGALNEAVLQEFEQKMLVLLRALKAHTGGVGDENAIALMLRQELEAVLRLPLLARRFAPRRSLKFNAAVEYLELDLKDLNLWGTLFGWLFVHALGQIGKPLEADEQSRTWIDELLVGRELANALRGLSLDGAAAARSLAIIKLLTSHQREFDPRKRSKGVALFLEAWLSDSEVQEFIQVHRYDGTLWFNQELFENLVRWIFRLAVLELTANPIAPSDNVAREILAMWELVGKMLKLEGESQYKLENLLYAARLLDAPAYRPRKTRQRAKSG